MTGRTLTETHHGNPGEKRILPAGILVELEPASNLPSSSMIEFKYWALPLSDHPWPTDTAEWARDVGVGLHADDVELTTQKTLTVPERHQLKIARDTLKMSDVGANVMGGPNKAEAREIIERLTGEKPREND